MDDEDIDFSSDDDADFFADATDADTIHILGLPAEDRHSFLTYFARRLGMDDLDAALRLYNEIFAHRIRLMPEGRRRGPFGIGVIRPFRRHETRQLVERMRAVRFQQRINNVGDQTLAQVLFCGGGAVEPGGNRSSLLGAVESQQATMDLNGRLQLHPNCPFLQSRQQFLQSHVHHKFQPHSLKQQILLQLAYKTFAQKRAATGQQKLGTTQKHGKLEGPCSVCRKDKEKKDEDQTSPNEPSLVQTLLADYPLPRDLKTMVEQAVDQLTKWLKENESLSESVRSGLLHNWFRCFFNDVHWAMDNSQMLIDRKETARMILSFIESPAVQGVGGGAAGAVENFYLSPTVEFLLAAANSLESHVTRLWTRLDGRVRDHWSTTDNLFNNPIISYWAAKCARNDAGLTGALRQIVKRAVEHESAEHMDEFRRFWPEYKEKFASQMPYLYDHLFHTAVSHGNLSIVCYIWSELAADQQKRRSLLSSVGCCGSRGAYHAFFCLLPAPVTNQDTNNGGDPQTTMTTTTLADFGTTPTTSANTNQAGAVPPAGSTNQIQAPPTAAGVSTNSGDAGHVTATATTTTSRTVAASLLATARKLADKEQQAKFVLKNSQKLCDVFEFLWSLLADDERNCVMLIDHSSLFCRAAQYGLYRIVYLMWTAASKNQRFVLLYQGNCAAFRESCALGHLETVVLLWNSCSDSHRRQLVTVGQNAAFINACVNNRPEVISYLLNNMDGSIKQFLFDSALCRGLDVAVFKGYFGVLYALKQATPVLQYVRFMLADDGALLKQCTANSHGAVGQSSSKTAPTDDDHWAAEARWLLANSEYYQQMLKQMDQSASSSATNGGKDYPMSDEWGGGGGASSSSRSGNPLVDPMTNQDEDMGFDEDALSE